MTGSRGPVKVLLGYLSEHFLMTAAELAKARQALVDYARDNGYELAAIYVERLESAPSAFQTLALELDRLDHVALLVPGVHHLAALGSPLDVKQELEKTGTKVLIAGQAT